MKSDGRNDSFDDKNCQNKFQVFDQNKFQDFLVTFKFLDCFSWSICGKGGKAGGEFESLLKATDHMMDSCNSELVDKRKNMLLLDKVRCGYFLMGCYSHL